MIWLLVWAKLKSAISAAWKAICAHPWQAAVLALLCLSWTLWHRGDRYRNKLLAANQIIAAGEANVKTLKADKARVETQQAAVTQRIDHETVIARKDALAAVNDYARTHQCVQPSAPAASRDAGSGVPEVPAAAGSAQTSSEAATLVAVPKWGADNCSLNTSDLNTAVEWARQINQPLPDPGH